VLFGFEHTLLTNNLDAFALYSGVVRIDIKGFSACFGYGREQAAPSVEWHSKAKG